MRTNWCAPTLLEMKDVILDRDVPGERDFVGEDVVVADHAVVRDVNADHEKIARADASGLSFAVGAMKRAKLANHIVVADFEIALLAFKLHILRLAADDGMLKNAVSRPDFRESFDDGIGPNLAIWANFHVIFDIAVG